ncbi:hypothetical protein EDB81DRAFT_353670 [Dactylonectria macrodidyma]|uniref:Rhodopsin domain-containing protein n=1 Tax=Dactylonectria macrodidyma TaxID=307937 RepID=A0A9P9FGJ8_9HYPO|nr:hypothetical protein EDB81DRAFT_353670 [Dactylonectria macrodidyma]
MPKTMDLSGSPAIEYRTREPVVIAVVSLLLSICTLMVGLRVWCRHSKNQLGLDDWAAVATLMSILACGTAIACLTRYGLGRHVWTLSPEEVVLYLRCFWVSIFFYMTSLALVKLTLLLQYYRLMSVSNMRTVFLAAIVIICLWAVSQIFIMLLSCIPLQATWDPRVHGKCGPNVLTLWYFNGVFNIVSDVAIFILPLPVIYKLQLPRSHKLCLVAIFCLGFFTVGVSILRMQWLRPQEDFTWWNVKPSSWSLAELTSAISCACLPTFKPLVTRVQIFIHDSFKGDSTTHLQQGSRQTDVECNFSLAESREQSSQDPRRPDKVHGYDIETTITAEERSW